MQQCLLLSRMRYKGAMGKGRTGDIPLKTNKHLPWLVKGKYLNKFPKIAS